MTVSEPTPTDTTAHLPTISDLRFEHHRETLGIGETAPRLSWITGTAALGWRQAAYEIERSGQGGEGGETTGRVASAESVLVPWPFAPLTSRERAMVRVRVWGEDGSASEWSEPATAEVGLLTLEDWTARFVAPIRDEDLSKPQPAPLLRREFDVKAGMVRARLYVTAQGVYEAGLNGERVGDHVLAPGWTSYDHRLRYQTFDVTGLLREGRNAIGATLGDGWFRGKLGFGGGRRNLYGTQLALLAQLEIGYADGTTERVVTDESWRSSTGPILGSDIYDGETYDARLEREGWSSPGYDDGEWSGVKAVERDFDTLVAPLGPPVRRIQTVAPVSIFPSPSGKTLVDFGQNLVGWVRLTVRGEAGQTVTLRHAEVLEHGELGTRPLRHAAATDRYTLRGGGEETWEPRFTFHGFRYAEVEGWPGELKPEDLVAVVLHSDMERTGTFECSDPLLNQLHQNVVWGMRGNFLDLPTDCPQRDERLGWTGDIQVFAPTASFLYDVSGFLSSWLADLAAEQTADGVVPFVVPNTQGEMALTPMTAWGDAAVIVPWVLYQRFGDTGILERQFGSMKGWLDHLGRLTGERRLWDKGFQFGDWLDPSAPPERPGAAKTQPGVVATAYFARSAELVGKVAGVLGRAEDEAKYLSLAAEVRNAFQREYVTPNGRVISDATTAYALALQFGLLPTEEQRRHAGERLAALARDSRYRVSTGFVGTPLICDALCSVGAYDAAYRLLTERECPSWLYPVTMGATTIWERWDSMLPDGSINPGEMTSFNHYALGAVADWMHRTVAGLAPAEPGYRRLDIRPVPGGGLTHARARHRTPYGWAESGWRIEDEQFTLEVTVPANTTARVSLPGGGETHEVGSGPHRWSVPLPAQAPRPPLTLDSTMNELVDDPEAYRLFMRLVRDHAPDVADHMATGPGGAGDRPIRRGLFMMPRVDEFLPRLEAALADLRG
ncbi:glycoside hydrolase family 78 protein [Deinococcus sp. YIM 134068]|uniref:glycoside hydrolase family 78 protein n=1 Tax=Deinococcus lichenicola TaxID=3118910 RepID=UPI002F940E51